METLVLILHIVICVLLILVVLLQPGKGSGMGVIGGGAGNTMFGARGAVGFLGKMTVWLAAGFMVFSLILARFSLTTSTVNPTRPPAGAPATPGATPGAPAEPGAAPEAPAQPAAPEAPAEPAAE